MHSINFAPDCTYFALQGKTTLRVGLAKKMHWSISTYMGPLGKSGGWKVTLMLRFLSCRAASRRGGELGGPSALRERGQVLILPENYVFSTYFVTTVKEGKEVLIGSSDASSTSRN